MHYELRMEEEDLQIGQRYLRKEKFGNYQVDTIQEVIAFDENGLGQKMVKYQIIEGKNKGLIDTVNATYFARSIERVI